MQLDPEAAAALAEACISGRLRGRTRELALELLANVGDEAAQRALREVLAHPSVIAADDYPSMLQRTLLLREPDADTVALLAERAETGTPEAARSAYVALGAAAGRANEVDRYGARLVDAFTRAQDPLDRRALVVGLGNTRAASARTTLIGAATDPDPALRVAAAHALGRVGGEASGDALAALLLDDDDAVRNAAVRAMRDAPPGADRFATIAAAVPELDRGTCVALVGFVEALRSHSAVLPLVRALVARRDLPADAAHRAMQVLGSIEGRGPR
ncbi:MAG: HEAT repeat domain-containing protein [Polyangiales bacterium]